MNKKRWFRLGLLLVIWSLGGLFYRAPPGWLAELDHLLLDHHQQRMRDERMTQPLEPALDPVVVGIDGPSEIAFQETPVALWHPIWGEFLKAMAIAKPGAVGFDYVFPASDYGQLFTTFSKAYIHRVDPDFDLSRLPKPEYHRPLLDGVLAALMGDKPVPLVFGLFWDQSGADMTISGSLLSLCYALSGRDPRAYIALQAAPDGRVRTYLYGVPGRRLPTLAVRMAELGSGRPPLDPEPGPEMLAGIIDYSQGPAYHQVSFTQVMAWYRAGDHQALIERFRGRPVLVGDTAGYQDIKKVPVANLVDKTDNVTLEPHEVPGVYVHAQAIRNLLSPQGLIEQDSRLPLFGTLPLPLPFLLFVASLVYGLGQRPLLGLAALVLIGGSVYFSSAMAVAAGTYVPVAAVLALLVISLTVGFSFEAIVGLLEKRQLEAIYGRYVSPRVKQLITSGQINPELGGTRLAVCALISDIRNFTNRSSHEDPETITNLLTRYFTEMANCIHDHDGTLDKFMGDGILAFFGAPSETRWNNPAMAAFLSSVCMLNKLQGFNASLIAEGVEPVRIGIGLDLGEAIIGHIGSRDRMEYTAIGTPINVASRLEGKTKSLGHALIFTENVHRALGDSDDRLNRLLGQPPGFGRRIPLGEHLVRGLDEPIKIFAWVFAREESEDEAV